MEMSDGTTRDEDDVAVVCRLMNVRQGLTVLAMRVEGHISHKEIKRVIGSVTNNSTLTTLKVVGNQIGDEGGKAVVDGLANNSTLTTLDLGGNKIGVEGGKAICEVLVNNSTLTTLSLGRNPIGDEGGKAIGERLWNNSTLTTLDLSLTGMTEEGGKAIGEGLAKNSTLTTLKLTCTNIGGVGGKAIGEGLAKNSTLTTLNLSYTNIGGVGGKAIGEGLAKNSTLTTLNVSRTNIDKEGRTAICKGLTNNSTLTTLNLSRTGFGAHGGKAIGEALAKNSTLTVLDLSCNSIGKEGGTAIGEGLAMNSTLTTLDLSSNWLSEEGGKAIGEALARNSTLTTLDLGQNSVGEEGGKAIGEGLANNSTLTTLNLRLNQIGKEGGKAIGEGLTSNSTLTTLNLRWNEIGEEGRKAIGDGLATNSTLTVLDVCFTGIGDVAGKAIGEGLWNNSTLTTLNLRMAGMCEVGGKAIGEALAKNSTLTTLDLSGNNIGKEGGEAIGEGLAKNLTLTTLDLCGTNIDKDGGKAIGEGLAKNSTLTTLDLSSTYVGEVGGKAIGEGLAKNSILTTLAMRDCFLTTLPISLGTLPSLSKLSVDGNQLVFPRKDIVDRGLHVEFLRECAKGTSTVKPRLVLIGNGGAGKTTIKFALTTNRGDVLGHVRAAMEAWRKEHWEEWLNEVCSSKEVTLEGGFAPVTPVDLSSQPSVSSLLNNIGNESVRSQIGRDIAAVKDATTESFWNWCKGLASTLTRLIWDESESDVYAYLTSIPHVATRSVDIVEWNHSGDGAAEIWDFAGQHQYFPANAVILGSSATVYLLVIDGSFDVAKQMWFWVSFVSSMQDPDSKLEPQIILMISKSDKCPDAASMCRMELGNVRRRFPSLNVVLGDQDTPFCVNYRERSSVDEIRLVVSKCLRNVQEGRFLEYNAFPLSFDDTFNELMSEMSDKAIALSRERFDDFVRSKLGDHSNLFTTFFEGRGDLHLLPSFAVMRPVLTSSFIMYRLCDPTSNLAKHQGRLSNVDMLRSVRLALEHHGFDTKTDDAVEQSALQLMQDYGLCLRLRDEWVMPSLLAHWDYDTSDIPFCEPFIGCIGRCITVRHSTTDRAVLPPGVFSEIVSKVFAWLGGGSEFVNKVCMDVFAFSSPVFGGPCVIELDSHSVYILAFGANHHRLLVEVMEVVMGVTAGFPGANWRLQHFCSTCAHEFLRSSTVERRTLCKVPRNDLKLTLEAPPKPLKDAPELPKVSPLECNPWLASHELGDRSVKVCSELHELSESIPLEPMPTPPWDLPDLALRCFRSVLRVVGQDEGDVVLGVLLDSKLVACPPVPFRPEHVLVGAGNPGVRVDVEGEVNWEGALRLSSDVSCHSPAAPQEHVYVWWDSSKGVKQWSLQRPAYVEGFVRFGRSVVTLSPGEASFPYLSRDVGLEKSSESQFDRIEGKLDQTQGMLGQVRGMVMENKEVLHRIVKLDAEWMQSHLLLCERVKMLLVDLKKRWASEDFPPFFLVSELPGELGEDNTQNTGRFERVSSAAAKARERLSMTTKVQVMFLCEDPDHGEYVSATTSSGDALVVKMPKDMPTKVVKVVTGARHVMKHATPFWNAACVICWMFGVPMIPLPAGSDIMNCARDAAGRNAALVTGDVERATRPASSGSDDAPVEEATAAGKYVVDTVTETSASGELTIDALTYTLGDIPNLRENGQFVRQHLDAFGQLILVVRKQGGPDLSDKRTWPVQWSSMKHRSGYVCEDCAKKRKNASEGERKRVKGKARRRRKAHGRNP
jgi:Ran GTPase-activating protein (RanGAP) involved in mRNA processing and transport